MFSLAGFLVRQGAGWNTEIKKNYLSQKKRICRVNIQTLRISRKKKKLVAIKENNKRKNNLFENIILSRFFVGLGAGLDTEIKNISPKQEE